MSYIAPFPSPQGPYPFTFQPQSTWGGIDYYRAHATNAETSLYEDAWGRVRDWDNSSSSLAAGMDEARRSHRRAYGNPREINHMMPEEIGHAAAFQAYSTWLQNNAMYDVLGDRERQREGLVGIAVAEVTRLLQNSTRQFDRYTQSLAAEAAAHTVTRLLYRGEGDYPGAQMMPGSFPGSVGGEDSWHRSRSRSRHRHSPRRHRSRSRAYGDYDMDLIPGQIPYASSHHGYAGSYNDPYNNGAWPIPATHSNYSTPGYSSSFPSQQLALSYPAQPIGMSTSYPGSAGAPLYGTQGSMSYAGYPGTGYSTPYSTPYSTGVPISPGSVVIVDSHKRRHRHRH